MRPLLALLALALAACAAGPPAGSTGPEARPTDRALAALDDSLGGLPQRRAAVLRRALVRGGLTPLADFGRASGPVARYETARGDAVAAFIPGRDPLARGELVVLGTSGTGAVAAEVALAALVLAERARWTGTPERTVQVVFWDEKDADPVARSLGAALWPREAVRAVVVVADEARAGAVPVVAVPPGAGGLPLVEALVEATVAAARRPALSDTAAAR